MNKPTVLVILDGFGWSTSAAQNAVTSAYKPCFDYLITHYPHTFLKSSGLAVGLPTGYIGNSEVGHTTIGAGRIVPQALVRINNAIKDGSLHHNPLIHKYFFKLARSGKALHLAGLLSDAGVHSHINHLFALLRVAKEYNIKKVYIHAFLDGRDVAPESAGQYLKELEMQCQALKIGTLASLIGRFFAMDRDTNWDRTEVTYNLMTTVEQSKYTTWQQALNAYYHQNIRDEFIPATQLDANGILSDGDGLLFFNFRPDRSRQLADCFTDPHQINFTQKKLNLAFCLTMTSYTKLSMDTHALFPDQIITDTLKEVLSRNHKTIFSIAETEKYAHITYFFGSGKEKPFPHETQKVIPSLSLQNYAQSPTMSAQKITDEVLHSLSTNVHDFYLINYANADMVGHSGDYYATIKAIECLDSQLKQLYDKVIGTLQGTLYITADHGKAETMFDTQTKQPRTSHTANLVPFIMINSMLKGQDHKLPLNGLKDVAPFILKNMNLPIPDVMI